MRQITGLILIAALAFGACGTAATTTPSLSPTQAASAGAPEGSTGAPGASPGAVEPNADEAQLLFGARLDLQGACGPLRTELAEAAVAGVECRPTAGAVERVRLYLFDTQVVMLDTYLARLAAHDVQPRTNSGRCLPGQGSEGAYVPGDDGAILTPERGGCYVDAAGNAHYVVALPPFVLAEVDGRVGDINEVERFAWLGNQDVPGGPTLWRASGPASPEK